MSKLKSLLAVTVAAGLALGGVTATHAAPAKTLTVGLIGDINTFAASGSEFGNRNLPYQAVYDTLLVADPKGNLKPNVATKWAYDKAGTTLTLTLKSGIKFTDGTAVDAKAVVANLNAFKAGKSPDASNIASMVSAKAKGNTQVVIKLKDVDPAFVNYLARNAGLLESPKHIGASDEKTNPVGSGPYTLNKLKSKFGSVYTFNRNPKYWNTKAYPYDTVVFKVISDATAMVNALKTKAVDAANLASNDSITELKASGLKFEAHFLDWSGFSFVDRTGDLKSPIANVKVRQAINYALDRKALLQGVGSGFGKVTEQVFSPQSPGYVPALNTYYKYDLAKAKALMAEAGYADGFTISMPSLTAFLGEAPFTLMADQLKAIGITVKYTEEPFSTFFADILTPKYPMYWMQLEQSPNSWQFIQFLVSKTAVWNPDHFGDATSDALLVKIQHSTGAAQAKSLQALNTYIVKNAWFAPFYLSQGTFAHNSGVKVTSQAGNAVPYLSSFKPAK
jgi:peptide/nickel transport system substrate-binding protein